MKDTIVVKVGTKLLVTNDDKLDLNNLRQLVNQLSSANSKYNVVLVSSGAIISGSEILGIVPSTIPEKQAAAALGQILLMKEYSHFFEKNNQHTAQILLTKDGFYDETKKENIKNTIHTLLENNIIPIINENDSVATDEIQFGDNDLLSSHVSILLHAKKHIILTDQDGLYTAPPKTNDHAKLISELSSISDKMIADSTESVDQKGKGGIKSKLMAAQLSTQNGIMTHIANGRNQSVINDILNNKKVGTCIKPN